MTLRVLHVTGETGWRGGEVQVLLLVKFGMLIDPKVEHFLCCRPGSKIDREARSEQIAVINLPLRNGVDLASAVGLRQMCRHRGIDVIHCHSPNAHGVAMLSQAFGNGPRIISTKRTVFPVKRNWLSREKYRRTDLVICISEEVKQSIPVSVKANTQVIHSMYDPQSFKPVRWSEVLPKLPHPRVIGYVAAMTSEKDPYTFLEVAKVIASRRKDVAFVWMGDGILRNELSRNIEESGLGNRIFLVGHRPDILDWISALDIFFFPSKSEGLGSSVLQAFHCKVPVAASDAGGLRSLVKHRVNGLQAAVGDVPAFVQNLEELLDNPGLRDRLIHRGSETLLDFTPNKVIPEILRAYNQVADLGH